MAQSQARPNAIVGPEIWCKGADATLSLGAPRVRYAPCHAIGGSRASTFADWAQLAPGHWSSTDGALDVTASVALGASEVAHICVGVEARAPASIAFCSVELIARCPQPPHFLNRSLAWAPLAKQASLGSSTPLLLRWQSGETTVELRSPAGFVPYRLNWRAGRLWVGLILDAAALHPRWNFVEGTRSTAAPEWRPGQRISIELQLRTYSRTPPRPAALARFPAGAEAAFTLTDHSDFDLSERLRLFLHGDTQHQGWLGRGLRMSKGVFARPSDALHQATVPTLEDPDYAELIAQMAADRNEIVPHGLNERGNLSPEQFHATLSGFVREWAPRTWIDHGTTLDYCYTMGGAANPSYRLLDTLARAGVSSLWAYHDAPVDAAASLNVIASARADSSIIGWQIARHALRGEALVALHYLRSAVRRHVPGAAGRAIGEIISALRWLAMRSVGERRITRANLAHTWDKITRSLRFARDADQTSAEPYTRDELLEFAPVAYPERAVPLRYVNSDEPILFTTAEALHLRDVYTAPALERLLCERGLHLGHCYLLNQLPYIAGLFRRHGPELRIATEWHAFLDTLAARVRTGTIWNPPVAELMEWLRAFQQISATPAGDAAIELSNRHSVGVRDVTVLLAPAIAPQDVVWGNRPPSGWNSWGDWLAVWGDVPADGAVVVSWAKHRLS